MKLKNLKINIKDILPGLIGLVLLAVGGGLFIVGHSENSLLAKAATTQYTETWDAAQLLQVVHTATSCAFIGGNCGTAKGVPGAVIGVASWNVTGSYGTTTFSESWKVPNYNDLSNVYFSAGTGRINLNNNNPLGCADNFDKTKWLVSCSYNDLVNGATGTYIRDSLQLIAPSKLVDTQYGGSAGCATYNKIPVLTGGTSAGTATCDISLGSYGYTTFSSPNIDNNTPSPDGTSGAFMPLHWDVTGTITNN